jgi:hypothetical protein
MIKAFKQTSKRAKEQTALSNKQRNKGGGAAK